MSKTVTPLERCPNCKTLAPCRVVPLVKHHSGYECTRCSEVRWGGVLSSNGIRVVGYAYANGSSICWRCARANTPSGSCYPALPYCAGACAPIYFPPEENQVLDRHCDECGALIDDNC